MQNFKKSACQTIQNLLEPKTKFTKLLEKSSLSSSSSLHPHHLLLQRACMCLFNPDIVCHVSLMTTLMYFYVSCLCLHRKFSKHFLLFLCFVISIFSLHLQLAHGTFRTNICRHILFLCCVCLFLLKIDVLLKLMEKMKEIKALWRVFLSC